jgi:hypothetical protein
VTTVLLLLPLLLLAAAGAVTTANAPAIRLEDDRLDMSAAARLLKVHKATIYRWSERGVQGVKLPVLKVGLRIETTREALNWFCGQLTRLRDGEPAETCFKTSRQRKREIDESAAQAERLVG